MNFVFVAIVLLTAAGAAYTWRKTQGSRDRTREGPVPGYSFTDGDELQIEAPLSLQRGEDWVPRSIETFHSPDRPRIVLGIELHTEVDSDTLRDFLHDCAQDVVKRTRARVFFAETYQKEAPRAYYMWSPDRGGWTGRDDRQEVFVEVSDVRKGGEPVEPRPRI